MTKGKIILVAGILIFTFLLVYSPHFNYPMPLHIDEWHHISESIRLGNYGEYFVSLKLEVGKRFAGLEIGFHFFLFLVSQIFDLVLIYKFLPALWAALTALILFVIVYRKTDSDFPMALLAMIFFASLRSNVNLGGLWFFTPLTFSLPFIYLYIYYFTEGIRREKTNFILVSFAIMLFLLPIHSLSVLFALPALLIYAAANYRFVLKKSHVFAIFFLIPLAGILIYKAVLNLPWENLLAHLGQTLQFRYGWGVLEAQNFPTEVYSLIGYILALVGITYIIAYKKTADYLFFVLWPIILLLEILLYRLTGVSYLTPYQRNLYYLALAMPFLSALGWKLIVKLIGSAGDKLLARQNYSGGLTRLATISINFKLTPGQLKYLQAGVIAVVTTVIIFFSFFNYYNLPPELALYHAIDVEDYRTLLYLKDQPPGKVMATPFMSTATYPISRHDPVATLVFSGNTEIIESFFLASDCVGKAAIIKQYEIRYVISPAPLDCNYRVIYAQNSDIIYQID